MEYNIGTDDAPFIVILKLVDNNLVALDVDRNIIWQTLGNPACKDKPSIFTSMDDALQYFVSHYTRNI